MNFLLLQSLRLASQATSLYTREAHYRPIVHLKGVTHYTLLCKTCEKEYEQIVRTPFVFQQAKPALWKTPLFILFCVLCLFLSVRFLFFVRVGSKISADTGEKDAGACNDCGESGRLCLAVRQDQSQRKQDGGHENAGNGSGCDTCTACELCTENPA